MAAETAIEIKVMLFAGAREAAGKAELTLQCSAASSGEALLAALLKAEPKSVAHLPHNNSLRCASYQAPAITAHDRAYHTYSICSYCCYCYGQERVALIVRTATAAVFNHTSLTLTQQPTPHQTLHLP